MKTVKVLISIKVPDALVEEYERDIRRRLQDAATSIVHGLGRAISWATAKTYVSAELLKDKDK